MPKFTRNFISGRMNKVVDQRLLPDGEYVDAMNIRMGSTEQSEVGVIENTKGNLPLTSLNYIDGTPLSTDARCIGSIADSANETIYWFVHDSNFTASPTGKLDLIVSYNVFTDILTYHIISADDGTGINTTLNFNPAYLITGVNIIEDLLFFTDDYNAPRFINIRRNYPNPISYIDQFSAESILVIKRPPAESPDVQPIVTSGQENYMDTRFICFAYRYRYADGEYSATSQWSAPAFIPNPFQFSIDSYLNEGMVNLCNAAIITYNSGGPLVVGIDLLFKQSSNNIIKIIEKLDKADMGLVDNTEYQYTFSNSKIFTVLPESELLRLYDNVPRFAKAQTIMGNRLMYGNYVEGYDLIDLNGQPTMLEYTTELVSEIIGESSIDDSTDSSIYVIDPYPGVGVSVSNSVLYLNLDGVNLIEGAALSVQITLAHAEFSGPTTPTEETSEFSITFSFILPRDYSSVWDLATSVEFTDAVGSVSNIQPIATACDGITFTDAMNCSLPNNLTYALGSLVKAESGISFQGQPIEIISSPSSQQIGFKFVAMKYVDDITTPTTYAYEYYGVTFAEATYQEIGTPRSLHSNRGYEIGIVYMDEFNRATTALVSTNNTEYVPCGYSDRKNSIRVTIPPTQVAPAWAKRYKFVIKPDAETYETIYSSIFFLDPDDNNVYFLLEGENMRKVEVGDRYIVKSDSSGPTQNCVYATVLEKEAKQAGFIEPDSGATVPAGVYMKINPNSFSVVEDPNATIAPGTKTVGTFNSTEGPIMAYPMNIEDPANPGMYIDYSVPAGSRIKISVTTQRIGPGDGNRICEKRIYTLEKTLTSSANYDNMLDWWNGDNVGQVVDDGTSNVGAGNCAIENEYIPTLATSPTDIPYEFCKNFWRFYRDPVTNQLLLLIRAVQACSGANTNKRKSSIIANIQTFRAVSLFVFETQPLDALPDVFYENELSFSIDNLGNHMGNVQNQNIALGTPAIIDTEFFNCFAFGNGVESYKIRDSIVGKPFNLGERVTSVSAQNYKAADRFSDISYSGIYNPESNVNRLNEFNLGLLNYKQLEASFGEIFILDGRETDVLVLQEDKISYVLAGKNLLSDSVGGGAISSVPEVLGTQIARVEKYGISFNPESYVHWGYDRYFTDAKRGAVIQLRGSAYSNEELAVISDANMRTWFRDIFNDSFNTQKLGGFDPYMNEYVLTINDNDLPINPQCLACGVSQTFTLSTAEEEIKQLTYCVDLGPTVGATNVNWTVLNIEDGSEFEIIVTYNGDPVSSGTVTTSGSIEFNKNLVSEETAIITINYTGSISLSVLPDCCNAEEVTVVEIVLTNPVDAGKYIHAQYRYTSGSYISPLQSNLISFSSSTGNPLVSWYNPVTGFAGTGSIPPAGSTVRLISNQIPPDDFVFNSATNKFRYARTNTLYANNDTDMQTLLSISTVASPIAGSGSVYSADFTVPPSTSGSYLYLIWDFRSALPMQLCYTSPEDFSTIKNVCCNDCSICDSDCFNITLTNNSSEEEASITFADGLCSGKPEPTTVILDPSEITSVCVNNTSNYTIDSGSISIEISECNCGT